MAERLNLCLSSGLIMHKRLEAKAPQLEYLRSIVTSSLVDTKEEGESCGQGWKTGGAGGLMFLLLSRDLQGRMSKTVDDHGAATPQRPKSYKSWQDEFGRAVERKSEKGSVVSHDSSIPISLAYRQSLKRVGGD